MGNQHVSAVQAVVANPSCIATLQDCSPDCPLGRDNGDAIDLLLDRGVGEEIQEAVVIVATSHGKVLAISSPAEQAGNQFAQTGGQHDPYVRPKGQKFWDIRTEDVPVLVPARPRGCFQGFKEVGCLDDMIGRKHIDPLGLTPDFEARGEEFEV